MVKKAKTRNKGQSLLKIPLDYTLIDIETTGYDTRYDSIIEIGCIKYRDNKEIERYSSLVQPLPYDAKGEKYIPEFITKLTGITDEMLSKAPKFETAAEEVWHLLKGELLVGHNVNFDINFLYDHFINFNSEYIFNNDFVDTLRLARIALPDLQHHRLEDLDNYFNINMNHHRAIGDCEITYLVLQELSKVISEKHIDLSKSRRYNFDKKDLRSIAPENSEDFDISHPLFDKYCVFTGKLEQYSRKDAAQIVVNLGGHCENGVTRKTNFLVVGDFDYFSGVKNGKSSKMKKAEDLILQGQDLQIITETVFYDLITD